VSGTRIRLGISACLLGEEVRFDGGHKRDRFLTDVLGKHVEWVPVCPEVEMGLGTPRETLRLVHNGRRVRMLTTRTGIDHTAGMEGWASKRLRELALEDLSGYVLKSKSPSCGMERVTVYTVGRARVTHGRGLFADALLHRFPCLPVEDEARLVDGRLRDNFIERVFGCSRLKTLFHRAWSLAALVRFHTAHRIQLLSHSTSGYEDLTRLLARAKALPKCETREQYERGFMDTLRIITPARRHTKVLTHIVGQLRRTIDAQSTEEVMAAIHEYGRGSVSLIVPLTLVRDHVRLQRVASLAGQTYFEPYPDELMLPNDV
jgi:uncharacterized protein YbbK (DUF523 family)/uncharacterized protein YbgA (DUF1722 family)